MFGVVTRFHHRIIIARRDFFSFSLMGGSAAFVKVAVGGLYIIVIDLKILQNKSALEQISCGCLSNGNLVDCFTVEV